MTKSRRWRRQWRQPIQPPPKWPAIRWDRLADRQSWTSGASDAERSTDPKGRTLDPRPPIRRRPIQIKFRALIIKFDKFNCQSRRLWYVPVGVFWPFRCAIWPFDWEWLVAGRAPEANRHPERDGRVPQRSDQEETANLLRITTKEKKKSHEWCAVTINQ
jgi:hypothetical protein